MSITLIGPDGLETTMSRPGDNDASRSSGAEIAFRIDKDGCVTPATSQPPFGPGTVPESRPDDKDAFRSSGAETDLKIDKDGCVTPATSLPPFGPATLPDSAVYGLQTCSQCARAGATMHCARCSVSDVGKIRTFYCGKECQAKHWPMHKRDCSPRRDLARAVSVLAELWPAFEKATYMVQLTKAVEKNGIVGLQMAAIDKYDPRAWSGKPLFRAFPDQALPSGVPEDVKKAVLCDSTCEEVPGVGKPLIELLIGPLCRAIWEADITVKNQAKAVYAYSMPSRKGNSVAMLGHKVLRLHAGATGTYALDLTGAQLGWTEVLMDWNTYCAQRALTCDRLDPFGSVEQAEKAMMSLYPPASITGAQSRLRRQIIASVQTEVRNLAANHGGLREMFRRDETSFLAIRQDFLSRAIRVPQCAVDSLLSQGIGRVYMNSDGTVRVTRSPEDAERYRGVWLDDSDGQVTKMVEAGNTRRLWLQYSKRLRKAGLMK